MPDVDEEWARFEHEVIDQKTTSQKPLYWGIGIAASIALVAGIFLLNYDAEEQPTNISSRQTALHAGHSSLEERSSRVSPVRSILTSGASPPEGYGVSSRDRIENVGSLKRKELDLPFC